MAKQVKLSLSKILKAYSYMDGDYFNEFGVEIVKDKDGNIAGIVDGMVYMSNNDRTITFFSRPEETRDDNSFLQYFFSYDEVTVSLKPLKKFSIKPEGVKCYMELLSKATLEFPSREKVNEIYNSLDYAKIEVMVSEKRPQINKR